MVGFAGEHILENKPPLHGTQQNTSSLDQTSIYEKVYKQQLTITKFLGDDMHVKTLSGLNFK